MLKCFAEGRGRYALVRRVRGRVVSLYALVSLSLHEESSDTKREINLNFSKIDISNNILISYLLVIQD